MDKAAAPRAAARAALWALVLACAIASLFVAVTSAPLRADAEISARQAPNGRVVLDLPARFAPAKLYSGFEDAARGISIVILEAPAAAYAPMASGFTPEALATRGVIGARKGELARPGPHLYMRGQQRIPAGLYEKFFVLFEDRGVTVLVSANVPAPALADDPSISTEIEKILLSARTAETATHADLFELTDLASFKEAGTLIGTSKVYTRDGRLQSEKPEELRSIFIVAPSIDKRPVADAEAFARRLIEASRGYDNIAIKPAERITIDGMSGVRLTADAVDAKSGRPVVLHQTFLPVQGGGYFRMLGIAAGEEAQATLPEFDRLSAGFRLLPAGRP